MKSLWNKQWNVYLSVLYLLTLPITAGFLVGRYKGFDFWRGVYLTSSWLAFTALVLLPLFLLNRRGIGNQHEIEFAGLVDAVEHDVLIALLPVHKEGRVDVVDPVPGQGLVDDRKAQGGSAPPRPPPPGSWREGYG